MSARLSRRDLLAGASASLIAAPAVAQGAAHIVVIGGGFGGSSVARSLKQLAPNFRVTMVEPNRVFTACPFSNEVIAGLRDLPAQQFTYDGVARNGVEIHFTHASAIDAAAKRVTLADGTVLTYDRLVLSPGIDIRWGALRGYDDAASARMPHAWKAGEQTMLLRRQLEAMEDGGLVVMSAPDNPFRCPPGPYERASLIAWYLKTKKPKSKLILLDAKDNFSKQRLFQQAWSQLFPNLEWIGLSKGGKVSSVDADALSVKTDFETYKAQVVNIIPPQRAGLIAEAAGVSDRSGWCPIDPVTFESRLQPNIHVIGDAAVAGAMPKSAFAANAQGKVCAAAIVALLNNRSPQEPRLINTCYSIVMPDYGISVAGVYKPGKGLLMDVEGAGGTSPLQAPEATRKMEADLALDWYKTITSEVFG
jgi:NADPH-dependent 2,4-dienoyl-CoA reductase/sulfur reductase-like enzyme